MSGAVDRRGMLAVITLCAEGQVIGGCKSPCPLPVGTMRDNEAEILAMVIFVVGQVIEYHAPIHLFNIFGILSEPAGEREQIAVVEQRSRKRYREQAACSRGV